MGTERQVSDYEIGSEAWMRERVERGLDPAEADRPEDIRVLSLQLADEWPGTLPPWSASGTYFER